MKATLDGPTVCMDMTETHTLNEKEAVLRWFVIFAFADIKRITFLS